MRSSNIIGNSACPSCVARGRDKTKNHLMLFKDGGAFCNRCGYTEPPETFTEPVHDANKEPLDAVGIANVVTKIQENSAFLPIANRALKLHTCEHFGYRTSVSTADGSTHVAYYAPLVDKTNQIIGYKVKTPDKRIWIEGRAKGAMMFGWDKCPDRGNKLFITEGQEDAMSLYQVIYENVEPKFRNRVAVMSLQNGSGSADKEILLNIEKIQGFKEVVLCFDMDAAGAEGVNKALTVLDHSKVRVARYELKDANDMLKAGKDKDLYFACIQAPPPKPEKIISGNEITLEAVSTPLRAGIMTPYPGLNAKTQGLRYGPSAGEVTVICAGTGFGKTTLARELDYHLIKNTDLSIGHIFLEEKDIKTAQGLIAIDNNVPLGLYRKDPSIIPLEQRQKSLDTLIRNGRTYFMKHWGSLDSSVLIDHMMYLGKVCGCSFIFLDHISLVVSGEQSSSEGERKDLDILMTKLAAFSEESGVSVIAVVHLKRPDKGSYNEGKRVSLTALRGSAAIEQLAHNVWAIEGDQSGNNPDQRVLRILKSREWGEIGEADLLTYQKDTGRLVPIMQYEGGLSNVR